MRKWIEVEPFTDFGPDRLMPHAPAVLRFVEHSDIDGLRSEVRRWAPKVPGVYGMIDAVGRLIYVGKSKALRNRLLSYFMPTQEEEKSGRIAQSACRIVWETQPSEFAALLREQHLIRHFLPRFNVQGIPQRQRSVFLCLGRKPAETFYVSRDVDPRAVAWEGPLMGANRVGRVAEVLNRFFQLRDCSDKTSFQFSGQLQLFDLEIRPGCVRHEIGNCAGPCVQGCSRSVYQRQVDLARDFLLGRDESITVEIERLMKAAAQGLHFEQASRYRDDLKLVKWMSNRLQDHARAREQLTCIYPVQGCDQRPIWYLIRRGVVEHAVEAPKTARITKSLEKQLRHWHESDKTVGTGYVRCEENLAIVSGWFRKNASEQLMLRHVTGEPIHEDSTRAAASFKSKKCG
jgi:excinuclease ABC subunit C